MFPRLNNLVKSVSPIVLSCCIGLGFPTALLQAGEGTFQVPKFRSLPSHQLGGLEYRFLKKGTGKSPRVGHKIVAHYGGWLESGSVFDSSYSRNEAFQFTLGGRVIKGWNLMLNKMRVGDVVVVKIPPYLAYGNRDISVIPPNSTLYFQIELIDFQ
jgi:FKBP-type peptidyl-prolyl cis-trans isomerase